MFRLAPTKDAAFWKWYAEYLEGPIWAAKRAAVIARDRVCQGCGGPGTHVHHTDYDEAGREFLFQLMLLCEDCHDRWHFHGKYAVPGEKVPEGRGAPTFEPRPPRTEEERLAADEAWRRGAEALLAELEKLG
jgi:5-methylcytosine-specific restriction endonuclease McrA